MWSSVCVIECKMYSSFFVLICLSEKVFSMEKFPGFLRFGIYVSGEYLTTIVHIPASDAVSMAACLVPSVSLGLCDGLFFMLFVYLF